MIEAEKEIKAIKAAEDEVMMDPGEDQLKKSVNKAILRLYQKASSIIKWLLGNSSEVNEDVEKQIDDVNEKIKHYAMQTLKMTEEEAEELQIHYCEIGEFAVDGADDLKLLQKDFSDEAAQKALEKKNADLSKFDQKHSYPDDWLLKLPMDSESIAKLHNEAEPFILALFKDRGDKAAENGIKKINKRLPFESQLH